jgi:hypothetical protein
MSSIGNKQFFSLSLAITGSGYILRLGTCLHHSPSRCFLRRLNKTGGERRRLPHTSIIHMRLAADRQHHHLTRIAPTLSRMGMPLVRDY